MVFDGKNIRKLESPPLCTSLFDPLVLRDQLALESALIRFEHELFDPGVDTAQVLSGILFVPNLFEFILSSIGAGAAEYLQAYILQAVPLEASGFDDSIAKTLLARLAHYITGLSLTPDANKQFRRVNHALETLNAIATFLKKSTDDASSPISSISPLSAHRRRRGLSQAQQKKAARNEKAPTIDAKPFEDFGVHVPQTKDDAEKLAQPILDELRHILESYLDIIRKPEHIALIKEAYIPSNVPEPATPPLKHITTDRIETSPVGADNNIPSAYPMVQPLRAALHFDSPEGFGQWRILIPANASRDLREAQNKSPALFLIIVKKIKELSNGHFSYDNQKQLNRTTAGIPIYEAKMTSDSRLVYQIDCEQDFETSVARQVIRIFGIYTHAQLNRYDWVALGSRLAKRGDEYRRRCKIRSKSRQAGNNAVAPSFFPPEGDRVEHELKVQIPGRHVKEGEELQDSVMLEKFVTFSKAFLTNVLANQEGAHVFQMSPTEQQIVKHTGSSYVLGRSGTGKTTTMLFKILGIERAWRDNQGALEGTVHKPRQIFVTQSRMLAQKVEEYYKKLAASQGIGPAMGDNRTALINFDEERTWRPDLPTRFSELQDEHFPLFLTFDQLCVMLEADFSQTQHQTASEVSSDDGHRQQRTSFISYRRFQSSYWPHLPQKLTKLFEPSLVFAEFMGIIKGSERTLTSSTGYLDGDTYVALSHRMAGMFAHHREDLYKLYEAYIHLAKENVEYDAADRTHALLRSLNEFGIPGTKVDFLYVDEAQDNLLIDALVVRSLCDNPNGLFWAGDTAQTISAGSAFRFKDLKAFLYRMEKASYVSSMPTPKKYTEPKAFQLAVNYRSHGGIVDCAQSIIQIITHFWPHSIDRLAEEKAVHGGVKPIMFSGWDEESARFEQFLFGTSDHSIEFGATQCILVRDEAARDKLRSRVGDIGMILTLHESKGLEFNDVLLYNFFQDSDVTLSNWQVVLNTIQCDDTTTARPIETRHNIVCRELKFLYVAVTRARNNVWIADCSNKGDPMKDVWLSRQQITICTPADEVPKLATSSAQQEWADAGNTLFKNGTYRQAVHCYERAGMRRERDVAEAYSLRQDALSLSETSVVREHALVRAAEAFVGCGSVAFLADEVKAYYRLAAECFTEANIYHRAAEAYLAAEEYTESARAFRKAEMFDDAVRVVRDHTESVDFATADSIIAVAKLHYFKEHQLEQAVDLFNCVEDAMEYADDFDFDVAQAELLQQNGQISAAAELHYNEGRVLDALRLLLDAPEDAATQDQCMRYLVAGLWRFLSLGVPLDKLPTEFWALIDLAQEAKSTSHSHECTQIEMFQAIANGDFDSLYQLSARLLVDFGDKSAMVLALDHVFSQSVDLAKAATPFDIIANFQAFLRYAEVLADAAYVQDPCNKRGIQRLFGFTVSEDNLVTVYQGTVSYAAVQVSLSSSVPGDIRMQASDFEPILRQTIREHLKTRVQKENEACSSSQLLFPCVVFGIYDQCPKRQCTMGHTSGCDVCSIQSFNLRLRILLQQILIFHTAEYLFGHDKQMQERRFWMRSLYNMLHPAHHAFGSMVNSLWTTMPGAKRALSIVNHWVEDRLFSLDPYAMKSEHLFLTSFVQTSFLAFALNRSHAQKYLGSIPCVYKPPPRKYIRDGYYPIVHDVLLAIDGSRKQSIVAGYHFFRHACSTKLQIDIGIVCTLLESLCGSIVITRKYQQHGSLHNTILPRAWILDLCTDATVAQRDVPFPLILDLVNITKGLLMDIFSDRTFDHLFFANRAWYYTPSWELIHLMLFRICRCICILGCNVNSEVLRQRIVETTNVFSISPRQIPRLCQRYANARSWDDLWWALRTSDQYIRSNLDELVFLQDEARGPLKFIRGLMPFPCNSWESALRGLRARAQGQAVETFQNDSRMEHEAIHNNPPNSHSPDLHDHPNMEVHEPPLEDVEQPSLDPNLDRDETITTQMAAASDIHAAIVIQKAYRNFIQRKRKKAALVILKAYRRSNKRLSGIAETRKRWQAGCRKAREEFGLGHSYGRYFVGPLPRALVCLEKIHGYAYNAKDKVKRRLKNGYGQLEDVNAELHRSSRLFKQTTTLQKSLGPRSDFHHAQNIDEFKECIKKLDDLVLALPVEVRDEWELDYRLAMRAIRQGAEPGQVKVKKLRPRLNTDDLDSMYD